MRENMKYIKIFENLATKLMYTSYMPCLVLARVNFDWQILLETKTWLS